MEVLRDSLQERPPSYPLGSMSTYPMSPKEMTDRLMYFPRMLDKIRMHGSGNLPMDYCENFGRQKSLRRDDV
jgi:hypothetical protein